MISNFKRYTAAFLAAIMLLISSLAVSAPVTVYADQDDSVLEKITDAILNKAGLVLSRSAMQDFMTNFGDLIRSEIGIVTDTLGLNLSYLFNGCKDYDDYADAVNKAIDDSEIEDIFQGMENSAWRMLSNNAQSFKNFMAYMHWIGDTDNALETYYRFLQFYLYGLPDMDDGTRIRDKDASLKSDLKGKRFDIPSRVVNIFKEVADAWIEEYAGYYILKTYSISDIEPSTFSTRDLYDAVINIMTDYPESVIYFNYGKTASYGNYLSPVLLDQPYYVCNSKSDNSIYFYAYNLSWNKVDLPQFESKVDGYHLTTIYYWLSKYDAENVYLKDNAYGSLLHITSGFEYFLASVDVDSIKVFKSLDSMKSYDTGRQSFYYNSNYTSYDSSIDNSVDIGGDYIIDNSSSITYDIVNEEIINNYYDGISEEELQAILDAVLNSIDTSGSGSSGSGGNGNGGSSGGSIWDGLGDLMSGLSSFFGFILSLIGQIVDVVSGFLTGIVNLISGMDVFSGDFAVFLSSSFSWVPAEVWDVLIMGLTMIVGVAVVKALWK